LRLPRRVIPVQAVNEYRQLNEKSGEVKEFFEGKAKK
jgi:hypothetical protein